MDTSTRSLVHLRRINSRCRHCQQWRTSLAGLVEWQGIYVNLVTGRRLEFLAHNEKVNSVALSPNGRFALSGGNDYRLSMGYPYRGKFLRALSMSSASIVSPYKEMVCMPLLQMEAIRQSSGISEPEKKLPTCAVFLVS